jgi:hypothetical protein
VKRLDIRVSTVHYRAESGEGGTLMRAADQEAKRTGRKKIKSRKTGRERMMR